MMSEKLDTPTSLAAELRVVAKDFAAPDLIAEVRMRLQAIATRGDQIVTHRGQAQRLFDSFRPFVSTAVSGEELRIRCLKAVAILRAESVDENFVERASSPPEGTVAK